MIITKGRKDIKSQVLGKVKESNSMSFTLDKLQTSVLRPQYFHTAFGQTGWLPVGFVSHLSETLTPFVKQVVWLFWQIRTDHRYSGTKNCHLPHCRLDGAAKRNARYKGTGSK